MDKKRLKKRLKCFEEYKKGVEDYISNLNLDLELGYISYREYLKRLKEGSRFGKGLRDDVRICEERILDIKKRLKPGVSRVLLLTGVFVFALFLFGMFVNFFGFSITGYTVSVEVNKVVSSSAYLEIDGFSQSIPLNVTKINEDYFYNIDSLELNLGAGEHVIKIIDNENVEFETVVNIDAGLTEISIENVSDQTNTTESQINMTDINQITNITSEINQTNISEQSFLDKNKTINVSASKKFGGKKKILKKNVFGRIKAKNKKGQNVDVDFSIFNKSNNKKIKQRGVGNKIPKGLYNALITPTKGPIKNITFYNLNISSDDLEFGIDMDVTNDKFSQAFAVDPTTIDFDNATVNVKASGRDLFKCVDWDFSTGSCKGRWKKVADIIPGQDYNFTLTAEDPGYGENNKFINLLDKDDYLLDYDESVIDETTDEVDVEITPSYANKKFNKVLVKKHNKNDVNNDIKIDEDVNLTETEDENRIKNEFGIDLLNLDFIDTTITVNASGSDLLECNNWLLENQTCKDKKWKKIDDLIPGKEYNIAITEKEKKGFGESKSNLVFFDDDFNLLEYDEHVLDHNDDHLNLTYELKDLRPRRITVYRFNKWKNKNDFKIKRDLDKSFGFEFEEIYSLDPSDTDMEYANITSIAVGNTLFKCRDFNFSTQICYGRWEKIMDLEEDGEYSFFLTPEDPAYAEGNYTVNLIDNESYLINSNQTILNNENGVIDVKIEPSEIINDTINEIIFYGHSNISNKHDIIIVDDVNNGNFVKSYAIDPTNMNFNNASVKANAVGNSLYKCKDWDFSTLNCYGEWIKIMDIIPGEEYSFILTAEDPGYGELNVSSSCAENWTVQYTSCNVLDQKVKYYEDESSCGTTNDLPADDGTLESCDYIISNEFESVNFSELNLSYIDNLVLENISYGEINFSEVISINRSLDLDSNIEIGDNFISIDSDKLPELNKSAVLTFFNLSYINPVILRNGEVCNSSICEKISYAGGNLRFSVTGFTNYSSSEGAYCGDGSCGNGETCGSCSADCGSCSESSSSGGGGGGSSGVSEKEVNISKEKVKGVGKDKSDVDSGHEEGNQAKGSVEMGASDVKDIKPSRPNKFTGMVTDFLSGDSPRPYYMIPTLLLLIIFVAFISSGKIHLPKNIKGLLVILHSVFIVTILMILFSTIFDFSITGLSILENNNIKSISIGMMIIGLFVILFSFIVFVVRFVKKARK